MACVRRGLATAARESRKALAAPTDPGAATKPASGPEMGMGCCREGGDRGDGDSDGGVDCTAPEGGEISKAQRAASRLKSAAWVTAP